LSQSNGAVEPHGGKLVNRFAKKDIAGLNSFSINGDLANDVENIADGIFSPLEGFLNQQDFENVITKGKLANDISWTIPIVLDVDESTSKKFKDEGDILLQNPQGVNFAILHVEETFTFDRQKTVKGVYGTDDSNHPGVAKTMAMKDYLVGGKIDYIQRPDESIIRKYRKTAQETREEFKKLGWKTIVAFQTRNPPHVAHEMLQKTALTTRDGVFINPLIGKKKSGDFTDEIIIKSYETLIEHYYPKNRAELATLHTEMRFAGPKEAIHHAIMRQNYGCTNIIIGRDHAGVGNYYSPFAAQEIFKEYTDLKIQPIFFPAFFYCKKCLTYTNEKVCPHGAETREQVSGTKLREIIQQGKSPSEFILRPEVSKIIIDHDKPFVD